MFCIKLAYNINTLNFGQQAAKARCKLAPYVLLGIVFVLMRESVVLRDHFRTCEILIRLNHLSFGLLLSCKSRSLQVVQVVLLPPIFFCNVLMHVQWKCIHCPASRPYCPVINCCIVYCLTACPVVYCCSMLSVAWKADIYHSSQHIYDEKE